MGTGTGSRNGNGNREREIRLVPIIIEVRVRFCPQKRSERAVSPSRFLNLLSMAHCASNIKNLF